MIEGLIFVSTLYLSTRLDLFYENITGVAHLPYFRIPVILFTLISSGYFTYRMYHLFHRDVHHRFYQMIIVLTGFIMSAGSLFPYTINQRDISSILHVYCSMFGCVSFLVLLFIYTRKMALFNIRLYLKIHWFYDGFIQLFCLLFLFFGRVNGYIEILFSWIVCGYLYLIRRYEKV